MAGLRRRMVLIHLFLIAIALKVRLPSSADVLGFLLPVARRGPYLVRQGAAPPAATITECAPSPTVSASPYWFYFRSSWDHDA
jgi:hypothetical protein